MNIYHLRMRLWYPKKPPCVDSSRMSHNPNLAPSLVLDLFTVHRFSSLQQHWQFQPDILPYQPVGTSRFQDRLLHLWDVELIDVKGTPGSNYMVRRSDSICVKSTTSHVQKLRKRARFAVVIYKSTHRAWFPLYFIVIGVLFMYTQSCQAGGITRTLIEFIRYASPARENRLFRWHRLAGTQMHSRSTSPKLAAGQGGRHGVPALHGPQRHFFSKMHL